MAVGTAVAIASTLYSGYQAYNSSKEKESAKRALNGLAKPITTNVADGLQVSTLGAEMRREEQGRVSASEIDALRGSGTRGIIGGVGTVDAQDKATEQSIASNLDEQQKNIDVMKANDNIRLQGIEQDNYHRDVAGLSSQINASNAEMNQGIANTMISGANVANELSTPEGNARREAYRKEKAGNSNLKRSDFMKANPKSGYAKPIVNATSTNSNIVDGTSATLPAKEVQSISDNWNAVDNNVVGNGEDEFIYDKYNNPIKNPRYRPYANVTKERKTRVRYNKDGTLID